MTSSVRCRLRRSIFSGRGFLVVRLGRGRGAQDRRSAGFVEGCGLSGVWEAGCCGLLLCRRRRLLRGAAGCCGCSAGRSWWERATKRRTAPRRVERESQVLECFGAYGFLLRLDSFAIMKVVLGGRRMKQAAPSAYCNSPQWNSAKKSPICPPSPGCTCSRTPAGRFCTWARRGRCATACDRTSWNRSWQDAKTGSLVREIADLEYIVVDNEREALALENNLIKQHKPKFNVLLRDDKTYPYIRYTAFEKYPRVYVTRRLKKDGSIYFGPYFPAQPRVPHGPFDPQTFSGAVLHRGPDARASAALPAVLHSPLPGPVRRRAGHRRALRRSGARRATVSRRPPQRSVAQPGSSA